MTLSRLSLIFFLSASLAMFAIGIHFLAGNAFWLKVWTDFFWTSSSLICAWRCFKTSRHMKIRSLSLAWFWIGLGSAIWTIGMFIWSWKQLVYGVNLPFPDISTFFFLAIVPCLIIGLIYYCWDTSHHENKWINLADIGISLCVIAFVCIILFYKPIMEFQGPTFYLLMALAYPLLYITSLFFATLQIWESKPINKLPYTLLMLGMASLTGVNIAYAYGLLHRFYQPGVMLDVLWTLGFLFFFWAANEEEAHVVRRKTSEVGMLKPNLTRALFPGLALLFVIGAAYTYQKGLKNVDSLLLMLAVAFTILMGLRAWIAQSMQFKLQSSAEENSKKLDAIIQQMPAGLIITDVDSNRIHFYNNQAAEILQGKLFLVSELRKDKDEVDLLDGEKTVLRKISNIETKYKEKFSVLTFVDITERKQVYEEAKRVAQMREDFLLLVAHELKTPLTTLKLGMQIIEKRTTDESMKKVFRPCLEELRRFENLTNDLINISNIDAGRLSLGHQRINLKTVAEEIISRFNFELTSKRYSVNYLKMEDAFGNWDQLRIEQVIINLLNNAIKYGEHNPIDISVYNENEYAIFSIRDRGRGISAEDKTRIFDKFERASSTKHFGGFGIGLFISKTIAQAHNGSVEVSDAAGGGTVFTLKLPRVVP